MKQLPRVLLIAAAGMTAAASQARWMAADYNAPVERVIKNVEARIKKNPRDSEALYLLARLHSLAWAEEGQRLSLYGSGDRVTFPAWQTIRSDRTGRTPASTAERRHMVESLRYYQKAVLLQPTNPLFHFGRAWMMEMAAPYHGKLPRIEGISPQKDTAVEWYKRALAVNRKVYQLAKPIDLKKNGTMMGVPDGTLSKEAGLAVQRLISVQGVGEYRDGERADIDATIKEIDDMPKAITPVIFPVGGGEFSSLVNNSARTQFDLAGTDSSQTWPWVTRQAAFLVWDPQGTGKITSGRQLFGTSTFWMFFNTGYDALATLDDSGDGWLKGAELKGIAVWHDRNENGVSDPGEVKPVADWKILGIRTTHRERTGVMPWDKAGLEMAGRFVPTYDWTPTSHAD